MTAPNRILHTARSILGDSRSQFVVLNIAISFLLLVRSYFFMLVLEYRDLGLVAIVQSIIMVIGLSQFGVVNGAYRLFLSGDQKEQHHINNAVSTFILLISLLSVLVAAAITTQDSFTGYTFMIFASVAGGVGTLVRNWQTNQMIARNAFRMLNALNIGSLVLSLAFLLFVGTAPLIACILTTASYPVFFAILAWIADGHGRPDRISLSAALLKRFFATGFVIFLSGILLQVNIQIERLYVVTELGLEAVGHLFLATMFLTLVQLAPTALNSIFLPMAVRTHAGEDRAGLKRTLKSYLALLGAYGLACGLAVWLLAEPVLMLLAPKYVQDLPYVYILAPGALFLILAAPFALIFSVLIRFGRLLFAYIAGTVLLALALGSSAIIDLELSLQQVMGLRSVFLGLTAFLILLGWWALSHESNEFRLGRVER